MRNLVILIVTGSLCSSFTIVPNTSPYNSAGAVVSPTRNVGSDVYNICRLSQFGLSEKAFNEAWQGYQYLVSQKIIAGHYLSICDMSQSSLKKRLYIIDVQNEKLVFNTYVAHGRNSGGEYASHFSNKPESLQTSLGFYTTGVTYTGSHGLSLRLIGLEKGINDNAYERTIVLHGADYVSDSRAHNSNYMGRSFGCPAVPLAESTKIINIIKDGNCLFIYYPSQEYLQHSKILNG